MAARVKFLNAGADNLLIEFTDPHEVLGTYQSLITSHPAWLIDAVPAQQTLLVHINASLASLDTVRGFITTLPPDIEHHLEANHVDIEVCYDGNDLEFVCTSMNMNPAEFIEWHTNRSWTTAFVGFAPGFGYLTRTDHTVSIPRLDEPRLSVPAGAVALAGPYCGIYPRQSPGGWRIVGHTDVALWDTDRTPPSLLTPGTTIAFKAAQ